MTEESKEQPKEEQVKENKDSPATKSELAELRTMISDLKESFTSKETKEDTDTEVYEEEETSEQGSESERTNWKKKYEKAQRTLNAQDAAKKVLSKFEHANKEEVERLAAIGATEKAIKRAAEISHNEYLRGQKSVLSELEKKENALAEKYGEAWGHPDAGETGMTEGVVTSKDLGKMSVNEIKEALANKPYRGNVVIEDTEWK